MRFLADSHCYLENFIAIIITVLTSLSDSFALRVRNLSLLFHFYFNSFSHHTWMSSTNSFQCDMLNLSFIVECRYKCNVCDFFFISNSSVLCVEKSSKHIFDIQCLLVLDFLFFEMKKRQSEMRFFMEF